MKKTTFLTGNKTVLLYFSFLPPFPRPPQIGRFLSNALLQNKYLKKIYFKRV